MSRLSRKLLREPTWLEKEIGSDQYNLIGEKLRIEREEKIKTNPGGYVSEQVSEAEKYLRNGNYLAASDTIGVLKRLAKERNLPLPEDIDIFQRRIFIEGAFGYYREYLQNPNDELNKHMSQYFSQDGKISFSAVEAAKGVIRHDEVDKIIQAQNGEGCLAALLKMSGPEGGRKERR